METPEGRHLHFWSFFSGNCFLWQSEEDVIAAVRHEVKGWRWEQFPNNFTKTWIGSEFSGLLSSYYVMSLLYLCFPEEIVQGKIKIEEFDYFREDLAKETAPFKKAVYAKGSGNYRIIIGGNRYVVPKEYKDCLFKRLSRELAGVFAEGRDEMGRRKLVLEKYFCLNQQKGDKTLRAKDFLEPPEEVKKIAGPPVEALLKIVGQNRRIVDLTLSEILAYFD